jgi:DNA-binding transcriptional LysR family regulator
MKLRQLEYFVMTAEALNFRQAAARMKIAQPSLTQQIQRLEQELDVTLFRRDSHRVALTDAGHAFLTHARSTLTLARDAAAAAIDTAGDREAGRVGFARPAARWLSAAMSAMSAKHGAPQISIIPRELSTGEQLRALRAHEIDVGLLLGPVTDPSLASFPLGHEHFVAVLPPGHPLANQPWLRVRDLAGHRLAVLRRDLGPAAHEALLAAAYKTGTELDIAEEVDAPDTVLLLAAAGRAVGVVPASRARRTDGLAVVRELRDLIPEQVNVVWRAGPLPPVVTTLLAASQDGEDPGWNCGSSAISSQRPKSST